jgi:hypothetical protein
MFAAQIGNDGNLPAKKRRLALFSGFLTIVSLEQIRSAYMRPDRKKATSWPSQSGQAKNAK